jgi:hypothetical protein
MKSSFQAISMSITKSEKNNTYRLEMQVLCQRDLHQYAAFLGGIREKISGFPRSPT